MDANTHEVVVWTDPDRVGLVRAVLDSMAGRIKPIAIGAPSVRGLDGEVRDLAQHYDVPYHDDLRSLCIQHPAMFLLLASSRAQDADGFIPALEQGTLLVALEPPFHDFDGCDRWAQVLDRHRETAGGSASGLVLMPTFTRSEGLRQASEPAEAIGARPGAAMVSVGDGGVWSLRARLLDAWCAVLAFMPMPEAVDASILTPDRAAETEPSAEGRGRVTVHAKLPGEAACTLLVSDHGGPTRRRLEVFGEQGQLTATDEAYVLAQLDGEVLDRHGNLEAQPSHAELIAQQWSARIDRSPRRVEPPMTRVREALACVQACLLSARTGQAESPVRLMALTR